MISIVKKLFVLPMFSLILVITCAGHAYAEECQDENVAHTHEDGADSDNCEHPSLPKVEVHADPIDDGPIPTPFFGPPHIPQNPDNPPLDGEIDRTPWTPEEREQKREKCKKDAETQLESCRDKAAQDHLNEIKSCEIWSQTGVLIGGGGALSATRKRWGRGLMFGGLGGILAARANQCALTKAAERDAEVSSCNLTYHHNKNVCDSY